MDIRVSAQHMELTPALHDYVQSKLKRLSRPMDALGDVHVVLEAGKQEHRAEATVNTTGKQLFADSRHENMYAAIDSLADKLVRQVRRHKERLTDHHQAEGSINQRLD